MSNMNDAEFDRSFFENVGITLDILPERLKGELYKCPEDFTVREVYSEGICHIENPRESASFFEGDYIHALLIKKNISTFEACDIFSRENDIDYSLDISFCGLKDTLVITSQMICIKNKPGLKIKRTIFEDFFVTNLKPSNIKLKTGDHIGNNFIIRVRDVSTSSEKIKVIMENFRALTSNGLPNFYSLQRFGVRQDNHLLGKLLLEGRYEEFLRRFITYSRNETDNISEIRRKLEKDFGDWNKCLEIIGDLRELSDERDIITNMSKGDGLLASIKNVKISDFFLHSYSSYLFNKALSWLLKKDYKDITLEKIGSNSIFDEFNASIYSIILGLEGVSLEDFKKCPFNTPGHPRRSLFRPSSFEFSHDGDDLILNFTLGKGEYASLLIHFLIDSDAKKLC